ncbi:MAG: PCMD domain-containing protein [Alistipes sp.]
MGLAAGNLMSGIFYKDGLTTGVVEFGQPYTWTARPSGMKVKYHATVGIVNQAKHSGAPIGKGDQDKARIFVAIVDWNARHRVASGTDAPTGTWDPTETTATDEGKIIACGSLFIDRSTAGDRMTEITLPLDFYDTQARPRANTASSSPARPAPTATSWSAARRTRCTSTTSNGFIKPGALKPETQRKRLGRRRVPAF